MPNPKRKPAAVKEPACLNHPDRVATFSTTSNGAHQELFFCPSCVPKHWR